MFFRSPRTKLMTDPSTVRFFLTIKEHTSYYSNDNNRIITTSCAVLANKGYPRRTSFVAVVIYWPPVRLFDNHPYHDCHCRRVFFFSLATLCAANGNNISGLDRLSRIAHFFIHPKDKQAASAFRSYNLER